MCRSLFRRVCWGLLVGLCLSFCGGARSWAQSEGISKKTKRKIELDAKLSLLNELLSNPTIKKVGRVHWILRKKHARLLELRKSFGDITLSKRDSKSPLKVSGLRPSKKRGPELNTMMLRDSWSLPGMGVPSGKRDKAWEQQQERMAKERHEAERRRLLMIQKKEAQLAAKESRKRKFFLKGQRAFVRGRLSRAKRYFSRAQNKQALSQLKKFRQLLREGTELHQARNNTTLAIRVLQEAKELCVLLGGKGRGVFHKRVSQMLTNMYVAKAIFRMSQRDYPSAYTFLSEARRHTPRDRSTRRLLKEIRQRARRHYRLALEYLKKDKDLARGYFYKVIRLVDRRDPLGLKARKHLPQ